LGYRPEIASNVLTKLLSDIPHFNGMADCWASCRILSTGVLAARMAASAGKTTLHLSHRRESLNSMSKYCRDAQPSGAGSAPAGGKPARKAG
jgi:hypothetical protein